MIKLSNRQLLHITGEDATSFTQSLFTLNVETLEPGQLGFGGLLSPKGKIQCAFFITPHQNGFLLDYWAGAQNFATKLTMYRLRSKVVIEPIKEGQVFVDLSGDEANLTGEEVLYKGHDPRHSSMGQRIYTTGLFAPKEIEEESLYHAKRHQLGLAELGVDYQADEVFPHEALYDQFGGVDFKKGCYIGQEVVSRMHHKTKPKNRFITVASRQDLSQFAVGDEIRADRVLIGTLASHGADKGLALVRLDRAAKAKTNEAPFKIEHIPLQLDIPAWVSFTWETFVEEGA